MATPDPGPQQPALDLRPALGSVGRSSQLYTASVRLLLRRGSSLGLTLHGGAQALLWLVALLSFAAAGAIPTWPTEWVPYFTAVILILGAWLLVCPRLIAGIDLAARQLREVQAPAASAAGSSLAWHGRSAAPQSAALDLVPALVSRLVFLLAAPAGLGIAASLLSLMAAPILQANYHWGYWSPVALLYAIPFPIVVLAALAVVLTVWLRSLAEAATLHPLTPPPPPPSAPPATPIATAIPAEAVPGDPSAATRTAPRAPRARRRPPQS